MDFTVEFLRRDFSEALDFPQLEFEVNRYSFTAVGGPEAASISAMGPELALWELLEWLRAPVRIVDVNGDAVWWGMVSEVVVRVGAIEIGLSLEGMANRVAVAYSYVAPGSNTVGTRATTGWLQDDDAVSAYGIMELLASLSGATVEQAEARRARELAGKRYPIPVLRVAAGQGSLSATLMCRGWWDTLEWQYYVQLAGLESHEDGSASQALGELTGNQRVAQSLSLLANTNWEASRIWVKVKATGAPVDTLYAELYSDVAGAPGALLGSGSVAGGTIGSSSVWVEFELGTRVNVVYGTTYWIVLRRSGAVDAVNFYEVTVDEDLGYPRGVLRLWNGAAWVVRNVVTDEDVTSVDGDWVNLDGDKITAGTVVVEPDGGGTPFTEGVDYTIDYVDGRLFTIVAGSIGDGTALDVSYEYANADLAFKLAGEWETTRQIEEAVTADAEFITGVDLVDDSGVFSSQYRDGDTTVGQVVRELLESGTSNGLRLLATVTEARELRIYEQPEAEDVDDAELFLLIDGRLQDKWGRFVSHKALAGVWGALKDVLPATLDMGLIADPSLFFVERVEYPVSEGVPVLELAEGGSVWDVGKIGQG